MHGGSAVDRSGVRRQTQRAFERLAGALGVGAVIVVFHYLALGTVPTLVVAFILATVVGTLGIRRQVRGRQRRKPDV
jgi:hypothetical protein